uniref:Reverse transcriptase/retrotransposon-derived protein RNase H-like domain-containing protein n=1 Tax=Acanthochromis polyacanthus TaxID=80966 RepID=A0A3Q1FEY5_9TELE
MKTFLLFFKAPSTEAVREMAVSELGFFLGMVNQLGKFILQLAERDKALRDLLLKKNCWVFGVVQDKSFQDLKVALTSPPLLAVNDPNRDCKVTADMSSYGLGGFLLPNWGEEWRPVAFMSWSLTPTEQRCTQVEKEALDLTWACERLSKFLIGEHSKLNWKQPAAASSQQNVPETLVVLEPGLGEQKGRCAVIGDLEKNYKVAQ